MFIQATILPNTKFRKIYLEINKIPFILIPNYKRVNSFYETPAN